MTEKKYKMSFSTGGAFYQESLILAKRYTDIQDWNETRKEALSSNLLQTRTKSSAIRIIREIMSRLQCLKSNEMSLLIHGERNEQNSVLWVAICRNYQFIYEFSTEVIRENYLNFNYELSYTDFDSFFNRKADWNDHLDHISDMTRKKLRQVLFKMLREIEIIDKNKVIIPSILSPRLIDTIENPVHDLCIFPTTVM